MFIYRTNEWAGHTNGSTYWNEYRLEGNEVVKYKCFSMKIFDGDENYTSEGEEQVDSWALDDPSMPEWLRQYL